MPHLISATLTDGAYERFQEWPKRGPGEPGRSARLSMLLENGSEMQLRMEALEKRIGYLQSILAESKLHIFTYRASESLDPSVETYLSPRDLLLFETIDDAIDGTIHAFTCQHRPQREV